MPRLCRSLCRQGVSGSQSVAVWLLDVCFFAEAVLPLGHFVCSSLSQSECLTQPKSGTSRVQAEGCVMPGVELSQGPGWGQSRTGSLSPSGALAPKAAMLARVPQSPGASERCCPLLEPGTPREQPVHCPPPPSFLSHASALQLSGCQARELSQCRGTRAPCDHSSAQPWASVHLHHKWPPNGPECEVR